MTVTVTGVGLTATETVVVMVRRAVAVMVRGGGQVWGGSVAPGWDADGWDWDGPEQTPKEGLQPAPQWESVLPHLGGVRCAFADFDKDGKEGKAGTYQPCSEQQSP